MDKWNGGFLMTKRYAVILAAGQGTRMKSKLYKVLHPVLGRPMVQHVITHLKSIQLDEVVTVVGYGADKVTEHLRDESKFVVQEEQLGTGHAVLKAEDLLKDKEGTTIVVCGDTPLITEETYKELFNYHERNETKATILTAKAPNPKGYGRVIRNGQNEVERIVEHKDADDKERSVDEINTGTYCFDNKALFDALKEVSNDNAQGEYYLPDVTGILREKGEKISAFLTPNFEETLGVNDRVALAQAEKVMKQRINEKHMRNGVTIKDMDNTYIEPNVKIEQDVIIYPGSILSGDTTIKAGAQIGPYTEVINCVVGKDTAVRQSVLEDSQIGDHVKIGPYAHIRPDSNIRDEVKVGNFVEIKKSTIDQNSKIPHLSYIGDAVIGRRVNMGCGTITVNYDGNKKHVTTIEDDAFVGCNANLIAPLTVGKASYIAAGSTITSDVPNEALSIARSRQTDKEGYTKQRKKEKKD